MVSCVLQLQLQTNLPMACLHAQILKKMKGSELVGRTYKPMFPYFVGLKAAPGSNKGAFRVVADGYVTSDAGTGVVHQAPFFGEDDYRVCKKFGTHGLSFSAVRTIEEASSLVMRLIRGTVYI